MHKWKESEQDFTEQSENTSSPEVHKKMSLKGGAAKLKSGMLLDFH